MTSVSVQGRFLARQGEGMIGESNVASRLILDIRCKCSRTVQDCLANRPRSRIFPIIDIPRRPKSSLPRVVFEFCSGKW